MLAIKNNLMSENATRNLAESYNALSQSVNRLSTGQRINSASDDAAGLAVRELMRADIATLKQGSRNATDAINMLQTADGAMQVVDDSLIRMKELAEQASTGSYSDGQRNTMNSEFQEMANEIDRIANSTKFNGITMLNSATGNLTIHFGTGNNASNDEVAVAMADITKTGLGLDSLSISSQASAAAALTALDSAISSKDSARAAFGYKINRLQSAVRVTDIQAQNLMQSESSISDVDVASEMSKLTRNQVLAQAGVSMLAQANTLPQMALTLLRG